MYWRYNKYVILGNIILGIDPRSLLIYHSSSNKHQKASELCK